MEKSKIDRINELGRIAKERELTEAEKAEREALRKEYLEEFRRALRGDEKELSRGLRSSASFIRSELARRLNLRMTPELTFIRDTSLAHGAHIASLLHKIEAESPAVEDTPEAETEEETEQSDEN